MATITITPGNSFTATEAVTSTKLNDLGSPTAALTAASIGTADIADDAITPALIAGDAVTTPAILDANVTFAKLADVIDDDTMATATDTTLATSESIKAYVDTEISAGAVTSYKSLFVACPASGASAVFAHSLGAVPDIVNIQLKCTSSSNGFATGEIVMLANSFSYASYGNGVEIDATNVTFHNGPNGLILIAPNGSYQTILGATGNFEIKVIAAIL